MRELAVSGPRPPLVLLVDAREEGLDEAGLRSRLRVMSEGARHASRSYRHPLGLVALHHAAVGVDLERVEHHPEHFATSICTPDELSDPVLSGDDEAVSALWSAKEALAKALGDPLAHDPRRLPSPQRWREGRAGPWRVAPLAVPAGHVGWVCWRADAPVPARAVREVAA